MRIERLTLANEQAYEEMLDKKEDALLYVSLKYRTLLRQYLDAEDYYLLVKSGSEIIGAFPLFLKRNNKYGNILNSLPFYGSYGGILISSEASDPESVFKALAEALNDLARETDALLVTIITSPFERYHHFYEEYLVPSYKDNRIGQVSFLPKLTEDVEEVVMAMIHSKTRNMVRKARKSGIVHMHSPDLEVLRFLADTHQENMKTIGGRAKDWGFFKKVSEVFDYDTDYRVYTAVLNGRPVSALLVFYYNKAVEYFTPATVQEYRSLQPNSLLIFEAMKDAIRQGYCYWNFGGTSPGLRGLYHFKKRWGAKDMPYYYYIIIYQDISHILEMEPHTIHAEYPYFYVVPFSILKSSGSGNDAISESALF